jgi:hypothetical protein
VVLYEAKNQKGQFYSARKSVFPDSYFEIVNIDLKKQNKPYKIRFLIEVDMSTHNPGRFGRTKVAPGVAYIFSREYKERFGANSGYWLVIAKGGQTRIKNMMRQTEEQANDKVDIFFFTSLIELDGVNPLTSPIWRQIGKEDPRALIVL